MGVREVSPWLEPDPAGVGAALVVENQGADVSKDDEHRRGDNGQGDDKAHQLYRVAAGVAHAGRPGRSSQKGQRL